MAEIFPFRALHYNPKEFADLAKVATQPYDKITPEMQERYYELSSYNLVRIIRGRENPADTAQDNVYTRAARDFRQWIENGVLVPEPQPSIYPYDQTYCLPGKSTGSFARRGFIALGRVEDYSAGAVHRHEETLSAPKADRLELLKATRAHFGQIFVLYSDPQGKIEAMLATAKQDPPWQRLNDEYGTLHSLWRVADPLTIEQVVEAMRDKKLVIADGHHRYETALAYRNFFRAKAMYDNRAEYVMMTFIRMESEGLTILPTHRVVQNLARFDWAEFARALQRFFDVEVFPAAGPTEKWQRSFLESSARAGQEQPTFGAYSGPDKAMLLHLRKDFDPKIFLGDLPASLQRLDIVILHRLVLEQALGIDRQAIREEKNLRYLREPGVAVEMVQNGLAQVAFLMNPTPISAVWSNALAGQVLPQKSTDFYPKLLSGLTIYWMDNPAGM